jgi:hypothetical protein
MVILMTLSDLRSCIGAIFAQSHSSGNPITLSQGTHKPLVTAAYGLPAGTSPALESRGV